MFSFKSIQFIRKIYEIFSGESIGETFNLYMTSSSITPKLKIHRSRIK